MPDQGKIEEELRRKFGRNVVIVRHIPSPKEMAETQSWLERIVGLAGIQGWMWRSKRGALIALVVLPATVPSAIGGLIDFYKPVVTTGIELADTYVATLEGMSVGMSADLVAFLQHKPSGDDADVERRALIVPMAADARVQAVAGQQHYLDTKLWYLMDARWARAVEGNDITETSSIFVDGAWHTRGPRLLYTSDSLLGALHEVRQHPTGTQAHFMAFELRVRTLADTVASDMAHAIAQGDQQVTRAYGDAWVNEATSGALIAPSSLVPSAHTIVINLDRIEPSQISVVRAQTVES